MMILIFAMAALGQSPEQPARKDETVDRGREIVTQPAKDIGAAKTEIPVILERAQENPYGLSGLKSCAQIKAATTELDSVLGPDCKRCFQPTSAQGMSSPTRLAG